MIVCVCRRISDRDIQREARAGCASFDELQLNLGVAACCGCCHDYATEVFEQAREAAPATAEPGLALA